MLLVEKIFIKALSIENYTLFLQRPNLKGKDDIERWRLLTLVFGFIEPWKFNNSDRKQSHGRCPCIKAWVSELFVIGEVSKGPMRRQAAEDTPLSFCK